MVAVLCRNPEGDTFVPFVGLCHNVVLRWLGAWIYAGSDIEFDDEDLLSDAGVEVDGYHYWVQPVFECSLADCLDEGCCAHEHDRNTRWYNTNIQRVLEKQGFPPEVFSIEPRNR